MTPIRTFILGCLPASTIGTAQWIRSSSTLPTIDDGYSVGVYDNSIFLLGGHNNSKQLTEYEIANDTFTNHGTQTSWSSPVAGYAQYWTQEQEILYLKEWNSKNICIFNMRTKTFTSSYITNIPSDVLFYACLASDPTHLFVLGGSKQNRLTNYAPVSNVEAYEFKSGKWREGVVSMPNMKSKRADHSCITNDKDTLYAIGGYSTATTVLSSIEVIDTTTQSWKYIESLSLGLAWTRCVLYNEMIYIVGGAYANDINAQIWYGTDKVHTINVLNDDVAVLSDTMPVHVARGATVLSEDVLYVFRGWDAATNTNLNSWMIYDFNFIPTIATTMEPTRHPTNDPTTSKPTSIPTTYTSEPTMSVATLSPTEVREPTRHPTDNPTTPTPTTFVPTPREHTTAPTRSPIKSTTTPTSTPTGRPTGIPTINPSTHPTNSPSTHPSSQSTVNPTPNPSKSPTLKPTIAPSRRPIRGPTLVIHSHRPPHSPSIVTTSDSQNTRTETTDNNPTLATNTNQNMDLLILALVIVIVIAVIGIGCVAYLYYRTKMEKESQKHQDMVEKNHENIYASTADLDGMLVIDTIINNVQSIELVQERQEVEGCNQAIQYDVGHANDEEVVNENETVTKGEPQQNDAFLERGESEFEVVGDDVTPESPEGPVSTQCVL